MRITLNGKNRDIDEVLTVARLLELQQIAATQVAVEINGSIVSREMFGTHQVREGDTVEILRFVGGG